MTNEHQSGGLLSPADLDMALELANMTSGAGTATFAMLIGDGVELGQPEITEFAALEDMLNEAVPQQAVLAVSRLQNGFQVPMAYLLDLHSAIVLASVMMGGSPDTEATEISDIQLSAVGEAVSQMMGAAVNSLSQSISQPVEITSPEVAVFSPQKLLDMMPEVASDGLALISYPLSGGNVFLNATLFQIMPIQALRHQIAMLRSVTPPEVPDFMSGGPTASEMGAAPPLDSLAELAMAASAIGTPQEEQHVGIGAASGAGFSTGQTTVRQTPSNPVTVQPVEFPSFDSHVPAYGALNKNLELVLDVCLNLTVELGRTELPIKEVLELTRGSVIELNRVAGESVDLFANGKMIAKGEVVVIEDNFGLRITSIVSPADRIRGL
jgi:flagellar motor switch protein FliN/FliY